jgi:hypothetical protein
MLPRPHDRVAWLPQRTLILALFSLLLSAVAAGQAASREPHQPNEECLTAETFLNQKLFIWQKRLKLENWNISFKLVHPSELKPKTLGNIHWDADTRRADIKVLSPVDYKMDFPDALKDMEFTVVHELVHLQLSSLPRNEASRSAEEKAVNTITEALLNLDRQK